MFTNVLVGVDGRQGGSDAIALARQLASPDATITLANIYGSGWLLPRGIEVTAGLQRDDSERMLVAQRAAEGIDAQIVCAWNPSPGRGLHELAEHSRSDLIVVGLLTARPTGSRADRRRHQGVAQRGPLCDRGRSPCLHPDST